MYWNGSEFYIAYKFHGTLRRGIWEDWKQIARMFWKLFCKKKGVLTLGNTKTPVILKEE